MFRRKRKETGFDEAKQYVTDVGYPRKEVHDFTRRSPYWQYRPVRYQQYKPFEEYQAEIDQYLGKLFGGEIDEENGDILDNLIGDITRQALRHLDRQRVDHQDIIRSLYIRHESDRTQFENQLQHLEESLDENRRDQENVMRRLKDDEYVQNRRNKHEEN